MTDNPHTFWRRVRIKGLQVDLMTLRGVLRPTTPPTTRAITEGHIRSIEASIARYEQEIQQLEAEEGPHAA